MPHYSEKLTEHWKRKYDQLVYENEQNAKLVGRITSKLKEENSRLIDSNRELLEAAKAAKEMYEKVQPAGGYQGVYDSLVTAINNAKAIL